MKRSMLFGFLFLTWAQSSGAIWFLASDNAERQLVENQGGCTPNCLRFAYIATLEISKNEANMFRLTMLLSDESLAKKANAHVMMAQALQPRFSVLNVTMARRWLTIEGAESHHLPYLNELLQWLDDSSPTITAAGRFQFKK